ncbi:MAG: hypothetical protein ACLR7Z_05560 [Bilophila wadsworthia]
MGLDPAVSCIAAAMSAGGNASVGPGTSGPAPSAFNGRPTASVDRGAQSALPAARHARIRFAVVAFARPRMDHAASDRLVTLRRGSWWKVGEVAADPVVPFSSSSPPLFP